MRDSSELLDTFRKIENFPKRIQQILNLNVKVESIMEFLAL
jgi:hypothetical protein